MPRTPYAAKTLTDQVTALRKSAKFEMGDEDGLGVYRSVTFDKATTKFIGDALDYIEDDRIVGYGVGSKGELKVLFSERSTLADDREEFLIEDAITVAHEDSHDH